MVSSKVCTLQVFLRTRTTVLLPLLSPLSLPACLPPHWSGGPLQWWCWCCRELWEQGAERARWSSLMQQGMRRQSKAAQWRQESCTQSWSHCDGPHADVSCTLTEIPGKMQNHDIVYEQIMSHQQRAAFGQLGMSRNVCFIIPS